jgi:hypothetical protein
MITVDTLRAAPASAGYHRKTSPELDARAKALIFDRAFVQWSDRSQACFHSAARMRKPTGPFWFPWAYVAEELTTLTEALKQQGIPL